MGSGKDSGSAPKTYDYFGTIAGLIGWGPVDGIWSIQVDGKEVWSDVDGLPASGNFTDIVPTDQSYLQPGGYIRVYWGTQTQSADPALGLHPPLRGFSYIVFHRLLFGRERTTTPNVEVVVWRTPRVDPSLVAPAALGPVDGQVNPVAIMAEWLTALSGLEQPLSLFAAASWAAAADWIVTDPDRRQRMFCSHLLADSGDIRGLVLEMLELCELALSWDSDGRLVLRRLNLGEIPFEPPVLDAHSLTARVGVQTGGWGDVPTGMVVRFIDRASRWKEAAEKIDNIQARALRGEPDRQSLDTPFITSRSQAAAVCARALARAARPPSDLTAQVRSALAGELAVGTKALVDVEPEPGGGALYQIAVITERREPREGPVSLSLSADTLAEALPYLPLWVTPETPPGIVLPIQQALVIALAPEAWGFDAAVAVLAARPQADAIALRIYFAPVSDPDGFTRLGEQTGYAVRVSLETAADLPTTAWTLRLLDGADGPDAYLASRTPDDPGAANQDELLAILAELDGSGRVALGSDGQPIIEIVSIVSRAAVAADVHTYTVIRGRKGTVPWFWPAGAVGWIVPLVNLVPWTHPGIFNLVRGTEEGRLRLVSVTRYGEDDSDPVPERGFFLPVAYEVRPNIRWITPTDNPVTTDATGQLAISFVARDEGGDLVRLSLVSQRGSDPTVQHLSEEFPQTAQRSYSATLTFAGEGAHTLQAHAIDRLSHQSVALITVIVPSGAGAPTLKFSPRATHYYRGFVDVIIQVVSAADRIAYVVTLQREEAGAFERATVVLGNTVTVRISGGQRYLWATAGDGTNWAPWAYAAYVER